MQDTSVYLPELELSHIEQITFSNMGSDLILHLVRPQIDERKMQLTFEKVLFFSIDKDDAEEFCFSIINCRIEHVECGEEIIRALGGMDYSKPIGPVAYCQIEGCATIRVVSRSYQLA